MESINTPAGLMEAIWDIIHDEPDYAVFTRAAMKARLPYGKRVDNAIDRMLQRGELVRVADGRYKSIHR